MLSPVKKHRPNLSEIAYDEITEMVLFGEQAKGVRIVLNKMPERGSISRFWKRLRRRVIILQSNTFGLIFNP